jgi:cysteine-rich repeat protein
MIQSRLNPDKETCAYFLVTIFLVSICFITFGCIQKDLEKPPVDPTKTTEPECGNNVVDDNEECDTGGQSAECNDNCTLSECHDDILNSSAGEQCDDGIPGDQGNGCDDNCKRNNVCGNGILEDEIEDCDDGNTEDGDGCSSVCRNEKIFDTCGNGIQEYGGYCDDGNTEDGDGCDLNCQIEFECGNNVWDYGEQCDDGNTQNGDGCDSQCQAEFPGGSNIDLLASNLNYTGDISVSSTLFISALLTNLGEINAPSSTTAIFLFEWDDEIVDFLDWVFTPAIPAGKIDDNTVRNLPVEMPTPCLSFGTYKFGLFANYPPSFSEATYYNNVTMSKIFTMVGDGTCDPDTSATADSYEPDNNTSSATELIVDGPVSQDHNIHIGTDVDYFYFKPLSTEVAYQIDISDAVCISDDSKSLTLTLYANNGTTQLAYSKEIWEGGNKACPKITYVFPTSNISYYIKAGSHADGGDTSLGVFNNYDISVISIQGDDYEPDNEPADATPLAVDGTPSASHSIHVGTDLDFFVFIPTSNSALYTIEITNGACESEDERSLRLWLYDTNGTTQLATAQEEWGGMDKVCPKIQYIFPIADVAYYVAAGSHGSGGNTSLGIFANYDISITEELISGDLYEPDNDPGAATVLAIDGTPSDDHSIHWGGDLDYFKFTPTSTSVTYAIQITNGVCVSGDERSLRLWLYDTNGTTQLATAQEEWGGMDKVCPVIYYSFPSAGVTYYVAAGSHGPGGNTSMGVFGNYSIAIDIAPTIYHLGTYACTPDSDIDTWLVLYESDGTTFIAEDDDGHFSLYSKISMSLPSGTYYAVSENTYWWESGCYYFRVGTSSLPFSGPGNLTNDSGDILSNMSAADAAGALSFDTDYIHYSQPSNGDDWFLIVIP